MLALNAGVALQLCEIAEGVDFAHEAVLGGELIDQWHVVP
jgi:hypothetical protein